ncbi:hypothetical protein Back11_11460 [Paenibacillus baekrokdamisoli]|uniref:Uncharacterized protein n=1 Tax=Paenibacillus baekrokdamisoli TaxID=1712516 RepID=A0A3G9J1S4_9BACL|nr:hypothetical protein [Paenibacillus baekrokdamisoli]MBB3070447.1 NTP pyrophosphatase (non-canonical NTP hydrolase) [Paenibacillus baekrokdamisoli]BBH19801.1 hypothetical protein Back11_11460 [Paenibacillus baekrokdamisoli]
MDYKFAVVKITDIDNLHGKEKKMMYQILNAINDKRETEGKSINSYLVINTDEPYAPEVIEILKRNGHWGPSNADATKPVTINGLVKAAHQNAIDKGWYEEPRSFGECIALMHSELSEALEDHRNGHGFTEVYFEGDKPCGIPTELADTVIRIFDTCGHLGIDLEAAIAQKMTYNATRPHRHGGKKL